LASIYAATDDTGRKAFHRRINYFRRAKVLDDDNKLGKNTRGAFHIAQIERWFACLELTELGLSPAAAAELMTGHWHFFEPVFRDAQTSVLRGPSPDDVVLCIGGVHLMSGSWTATLGFPGVPNIQGCKLRKLPDRVMMWMWMTASDPAAARLLILNLSERLRQLHKAIGDAYAEDMATKCSASKLGAGADRGVGGKRGS
jgi:hypothetical protein